MNTHANERSWLLNRDLLKLVHQCRRLIHMEFGVKLHLTEEDLEQQLANYARRSRSNQLRHAWEALKDQIPELDVETEQASKSPRRIYRGQVVEEGTARAQASADPEPPSRPKKKVIYRGHEVG